MVTSFCKHLPEYSVAIAMNNMEESDLATAFNLSRRSDNSVGYLLLDSVTVLRECIRVFRIILRINSGYFLK
jgi:hypothetical protein